jgi:hypothetical protein
MRIRATDSRERLWDDLEDATGHGHTSQALDDAARLYVKLRGDTTAVPTGRVEQLLREADNADGGLGPEAIAEILDTDELPVTANEPPTEISVGDE